MYSRERQLDLRSRNTTEALRLLVNVVRVTNMEVVKNRVWSSFFFLSFFSHAAYSTLTRAVPRTKHPRIAVKFLEDVPFELSF